MKSEELVVSNTSPLLNLALLDRLELVETQFSTVAVPQAVWHELTAGTDGVDALQSARDDGTIRVVSAPETKLFVEFRHELDAGEAAALAYALENDATLVLIDERDGRQAARRHDLTVTGVVGVLLRAAEDGDEMRASLDSLREAGFWIGDDLYEKATEQADSDERY